MSTALVYLTQTGSKKMQKLQEKSQFKLNIKNACKNCCIKRKSKLYDTNTLNFISLGKFSDIQSNLGDKLSLLK